MFITGIGLGPIPNPFQVRLFAVMQSSSVRFGSNADNAAKSRDRFIPESGHSDIVRSRAPSEKTWSSDDTPSRLSVTAALVSHFCMTHLKFNLRPDCR